MEALIGLFLVPIVIGGCAFFILKMTITWKEFLLQLGASALLIFGAFFIARLGALADTEHWNGRITAKDKGTEHCCHSYQCNCQTCTSRDAKGNVSTYSCNCQTCYHHSRDYWWKLKVSTGDTISDTCDSSSSDPKWWTGATVGDPATVAHSYQNYLKADPESLFTHDTGKKAYLDDVPDDGIPEVHGRYKVKKVIERGVKAPKRWNDDLREINADLGGKKQIDLLVYLTKSKDPEYAWAVEEKWLYGPKNSLIVVMGVSDGKTIEWVRVVTISRVEDLKVEVRDTLQGKTLDDPEIMPFLRDVVKRKFHRTSMGEFEYLASAASPEGWWLALLYLLAILISGGLTYWMHREDVFGDEHLLNR